MLIAFSFSALLQVKLSSSISIFAPASFSFDVNDSMCSGIIFVIFRLSPSKAPIIVYVPASILSGIISAKPFVNFSTPFILITLVPAPVILHPLYLGMLQHLLFLAL